MESLNKPIEGELITKDIGFGRENVSELTTQKGIPTTVLVMASQTTPYPVKHNIAPTASRSQGGSHV